MFSEICFFMECFFCFIFLSGFFGVVVGLFVLVGVMVVYVYLGVILFENKKIYYEIVVLVDKWGIDYVSFFLVMGLFVFLGVICFGIYFMICKVK